ncbi:MAG: hypothetical protein ACRD3P_20075 [Terriglobales bacterium]
MRSVCTIALCITAILGFTAELRAQRTERQLVIDSHSAELLPISRRVLHDSGRIFSGTVLQVEHRDSGSSSALATTRIVFRVDEAIRNVRRGQTVEINEWAGLWQSGERYHPGERALIFFYPPSKLGLTSPVGNRAGRFAVNRAGSVTFKAPPGRPSRTIEIRRVAAAIRQAEKDSR